MSVARSVLLAAIMLAVIVGILGMHIVSSAEQPSAHGSHGSEIAMQHPETLASAAISGSMGSSTGLMSSMAAGCVLALGALSALALAAFPAGRGVVTYPTLRVTIPPGLRSHPRKPPPPLSLLSVNRQ